MVNLIQNIQQRKKKIKIIKKTGLIRAKAVSGEGTRKRAGAERTVLVTAIALAIIAVSLVIIFRVLA